MIIDKPTNLMWKEINRINRCRSATRLWNFKHKHTTEYKLKKQLQDKVHYNKTKNSKNRKIRRLIDSHCNKRYNPLIVICKYCKNEFVSTQGNNNLFCTLKHKRKFFKYKSIRISGKKMNLHRFIMENHINRKLKKKELVHHIDGNILNNNINNLMITNQSKHLKLHKNINHPVHRYTGKKSMVGVIIPSLK